MTTLGALGFDNPAVRMLLRFDARRHGCRLLCGPYAWDLLKDSRFIRIGRKQFEHVAHLASHFDELFDTLIPLQSGEQTFLDFSRIHLHTYRSSGITFELAQWPEPDAAIEAYFAWYRPTPQDLIFDLGAECGVSTYVLARRAASVIAFEPDAHLRVLLERNLVRHTLTNVTVASPSTGSLSQLIALYGAPAFCKVNIDQIAPDFLRNSISGWLPYPISFAARSKTPGLRARFQALLKSNGFETDANSSLGVVWAART